MARNNKLNTLTKKGLSSALAREVIDKGYNATQISKKNKKEIISIFGKEKGGILYSKLVRKPIPIKTKEEIVRRNKGICCICRERGKGYNFHHIDENPSNNTLENIALLCVKDHDLHHRYNEYDNTNHSELTRAQIIDYKNQWEWFIEEAQKENPELIAVINIYGTEEQIHSMRFFIQDIDQNILFKRLNHIHTTPESWIDQAINDIMVFGKNISLSVIDEPLGIEYCPCGCNSSLASVLDSNVALKCTAKDWKENSIASIYLNPKIPRITILLFYKDNIIFTGVLCKENEDTMIFESTNYFERIWIESNVDLQDQAQQIVRKVILAWEPNLVYMGTGDEDSPDLIKDFYLPEIWN
jgi:hypothetical protein